LLSEARAAGHGWLEGQRERLWFISAPGSHLAGLVQVLWDQGKVRGCRHPPVSWALGVIARRGVRVAAAEVDIYIMTLWVWGRKWNWGCAETLSFPHTSAHGSSREAWGEPQQVRPNHEHTQVSASSLRCWSQGSTRPQRFTSLSVLGLSPFFLPQLVPPHGREIPTVLHSFVGMVWGYIGK
jgi:hypothetical protein